MAVEAELKFICDATLTPQLEALWPTLASQVTAQPVAALINAYYDSQQHWFRQQDAGLRTRLKNGRYEQTIKLAGQQQGALQIRPEYNLPAAGVWPELAAFPPEIWPECTDVAALQQDLVQLFCTDFQRQSWLLQLESGAVIDVALDQGWVKADGRQQAIHELELELISGPVSSLFQLGQQLLEQLPLRLGVMSKAERGYRLAQHQPLQLTETVSTQPAALLNAILYNESYWYQQQDQAVWSLLQQQWQQLATQLPLCAEIARQPFAPALLQTKAYVLTQLQLSEWCCKESV